MVELVRRSAVRATSRPWRALGRGDCVGSTTAPVSQRREEWLQRAPLAAEWNLRRGDFNVYVPVVSEQRGYLPDLSIDF